MASIEINSSRSQERAIKYFWLGEHQRIWHLRSGWSQADNLDGCVFPCVDWGNVLNWTRSHNINTWYCTPLIGALHKSGFFSWKVFSIQPFHGVPRLRGDMFANVMMLVMLRPTISELSKAHKSHDMPWMSDTELPR